MEWVFVARSKGGKEILGSLFSMFVPVKWPFHSVQHGGIYQAGGSVTKVHYLLFSQAPCDNTS
ncbi:MAG TPA: hypothetical protein VEX65_03550, partial [Flavisolibacter sp.]|nr:hypothetical protein [Flavisolibacter sp.]